MLLGLFHIDGEKDYFRQTYPISSRRNSRILLHHVLTERDATVKILSIPLVSDESGFVACTVALEWNIGIRKDKYTHDYGAWRNKRGQWGHEKCAVRRDAASVGRLAVEFRGRRSKHSACLKSWPNSLRLWQPSLTTKATELRNDVHYSSDIAYKRRLSAEHGVVRHSINWRLLKLIILKTWPA